MKDLCQQWKVQLTFRSAYRLSGTWIVECLVMIDVIWNSFIAYPDWPDPPPHILRQIHAIVVSYRKVP